MAPNGENGIVTMNELATKFEYALDEEENEQLEQSKDFLKTNPAVSDLKQDKYKYQLVWRNIAAMLFLHLGWFYALTLVPEAKRATLWFMFFIMFFTSLGIQAGAHRLWCHRTYKANFGFRLFLAFWQTVALQNDIYEWSRDHRVHHKFSDTNADPHNSSNGFFFSHVGWLLVRKHPEVIRRGRSISMADLEADPIVRFQRAFYIPLVVLLWGMFPTFVPVYFWGENIFTAAMLCVIFRYVSTLNLTWLVNSWAHLYGSRPYDQRIAPVEATIRHLLIGEGFHNYHHAYPWDYSASEFGAIDVFNPATALIDFAHKMGWAWDLKKVNPVMIEKRRIAHGDPAYYHKKNSSLFEWSTGILSYLIPGYFLFYFNNNY